LLLVNATASSGTAMATIGTNTVTWNGSIGAGNVATVTITAAINAGTEGTSISSQGTVAYDGDADGTNETTALTDDPGVGGTSDPTVFAVKYAKVKAIMTVGGALKPNTLATYTIGLTNTGNIATNNNSGDELVDVLPADVVFMNMSASSGVLSLGGPNTVHWNGAIAAGGIVTITIETGIKQGTEGHLVSNQATIHYDSNGDGGNDGTIMSDDPGQPGASDPTTFTVIDLIFADGFE